MVILAPYEHKNPQRFRLSLYWWLLLRVIKNGKFIVVTSTGGERKSFIGDNCLILGRCPLCFMCLLESPQWGQRLQQKADRLLYIPYSILNWNKMRSRDPFKNVYRCHSVPIISCLRTPLNYWHPDNDWEGWDLSCSISIWVWYEPHCVCLSMHYPFCAVTEDFFFLQLACWFLYRLLFCSFS